MAVLGSKQLMLDALDVVRSFPNIELSAIISFDDSIDGRSRLVEIQKFPNALFVSAPSQIEEILAFTSYDVLLVVGWPWIIDPKLINKAKFGAFGFHFSLLPKLRGFAPANWAIISGLKNTGVTVFQLSENADEGQILFQKKISVGKNEYISDLLQNLNGTAKLLLHDFFDAVESNLFELKEQSRFGKSYGIKRNSQSSLIHWEESPKKIYRNIRASSRPFLGAFTTLESCKIVIWRATINRSYKILGEEGQVAFIHAEGFSVKLKGSFLLEVSDFSTIHSENCLNTRKNHSVRLGVHLGIKEK
jgi:methionyl-tRNA formyltransferase